MEQNEALQQIKYIREMMDKASQRMFFSPWQWIEWGALVMAAGIWTQHMLNRGQQHYILYLWIIVFIVGSTLETLFWMREAQMRGVEPLNPFLMKVWGIALGIFLIPIVFTPVFINIHLPQYIPGIWMLSIGVAMFAWVLLSIRKEIWIFCELMLISGILSVSLFLDHSLAILTWSFGLGGFLMGIYLMLTQKRNKE